jgi:AraC family transcriptional regulator
MIVERLPSGSFLGSRSATVEVGDFKAGLWRASVPPEGVHLHVHEDAHFVLALDEGYRSLAHDAHSRGGAAFRQGALVWNPPGVEHRDSFERPGGRFLSVSFMPPAGVRHGEPVRLHGGAALAAARAAVGAVATFRAGDAVRLEGLLLDLAGSAIASRELDEDPAPNWVLRAHEMILDNARTAGLQIRGGR